jgi:hypothetical protein
MMRKNISKRLSVLLTRASKNGDCYTEGNEEDQTVKKSIRWHI